MVTAPGRWEGGPLAWASGPACPSGDGYIRGSSCGPLRAPCVRCPAFGRAVGAYRGFVFGAPATSSARPVPGAHSRRPSGARPTESRLFNRDVRSRFFLHLRAGQDVFEKVEQVHCLVHRSEEHTSELQSPCNLVCRLLLEKKKQ